MKYLLLAMLIIGILLSCTPQTAGTVDDVGVISGRLITGDGNPVDYTVTVFLYRTASTTANVYPTGLSKVVANVGTPFRIVETTTGVYTFDSIPAGEYRIEVAEDDIIVAKEENVLFVSETPKNDTITVEEVMSLGFMIDSASSKGIIVGESLIDNSKVVRTDNGYVVKAVAAREVTFKMVMQQDGVIDTLSVHATLDSSKSASFEVVAGPVDFTLIPVNEGTVLIEKHSILHITIVAIPATFSRLQLLVDGEVKTDSVFTTAASLDSVVFAVDNLAGDASGIPHVLSLQATERYRGSDRTFIALDTTITAFSRSNTWFSAKLTMPEAIVHSGMKLIPAGTFTMGPDSTNYASVPGVITREVTLTRDFRMDSTEVTQRDFAQIMIATYGSQFVPDWDSLGWGSGDDYPAHSVNWIDAALYCNALTKASGSVDTVYRYESMSPDSLFADRVVLNGLVINLNKGGFHLPTEAQWEYACRGGTTTDYYFDSASVDEYAWHAGNSEHTAHPVARKLPNAFGLYDMIGNLREWCNDWEWDYDPTSLIDPTGPESTPPNTRIQRGDDWADPPAKSCTRLYYPYLSRIPPAGFRVCKTVR